MKKIGVLIDSTTCDRYLFETVSELSNSNDVELFLLLSKTEQQNTRGKTNRDIKSRGLRRTIDAILFSLLTRAESAILSILLPDLKKHHKRMSLDEFVENELVNLGPVVSTSGDGIRYSDQDINAVKSLDLDLIIGGNVKGIFEGRVLGAARDGIISIHHGDTRWGRGGPPAFWEVYLRERSTGFVIELSTAEPDCRSVIFRGSCITCRSYTENIAQICGESNPYLAKLVLKYANSGQLPPPEEPIPFGEPVLAVPSYWQSIVYSFKTAFIFLSLIVNRKVLRKDKRWSVAYFPGPWREASLREGTQIENPPNRFFADPFVVEKDSRTVCFVEDYDYGKGIGCITAIEIIDGKSYRVLGPVLEEPFHMSFPFVFEYEDDLYMIPEISQSRAIRLYRCVRFPLQWEYQQDIMSDVNAVDSMVFEYEGKWWLLTNMTLNENGVHSSQLFAFHSSSPLSAEWVAHERNPLVFDSEIGRNGGILDVDGDSPVRVRQKQGFDFYGSSFTLAKIVDLTTSSYEEQEIGRILPNFISDIKGCHHFHSNGEYTVYDYVRIETQK